MMGEYVCPGYLIVFTKLMSLSCVNALSWSDDGNTLLSGSDDRRYVHQFTFEGYF